MINMKFTNFRILAYFIILLPTFALAKNLDDITCISESNFCISVGNYGVILTSSDSGVTWTQQFSGTSYHLSDADCVNQQFCVAVGQYGTILTSSNAGVTWIPQYAGTSHSLYDVDCVSEEFCVIAGGFGTILTSSDRGVSWTRRATNTWNFLLGVSCVSKNFCIVVGEFGTVLTSYNGGINWFFQYSGTPSSLFDVTCLEKNFCIAVGEWGSILVSFNEGISWNFQYPGVLNSFLDVTCIAKNLCIVIVDNIFGLFPAFLLANSSWGQFSFKKFGDTMCVNPQFCIAIGPQGSIFVSSDGGTTWTTQLQNTNNIELPNSILNPPSTSKPSQNINIFINPLPSKRKLWIDVHATGSAGGKVETYPEGIYCDEEGGICEYSFDTASSVVLRATPNQNSEFLMFGGDLDCFDYQIFMDKNVFCEAFFMPIVPSTPAPATTAASLPTIGSLPTTGTSNSISTYFSDQQCKVNCSNTWLGCYKALSFNYDVDDEIDDKRECDREKTYCLADCAM